MVTRRALCAEEEEMTVGAWSLISAVTLPGLTQLVTVVSISEEAAVTGEVVEGAVVVVGVAVVEGAVVVEAAVDVVVVGDVVDVVVDNLLFRINQICIL